MLTNENHKQTLKIINNMFTQDDVDQLCQAVEKRGDLADCQTIAARCGNDIITAQCQSGFYVRACRRG